MEQRTSGRGGPGARIEYFDVLRSISIVAVVMIHAVITEWHRLPVDEPRADAFAWIGAMLRWSVPVFFMISGALFLAPERTVTIGSLFRRRIPRLLAAFAAWSSLYAALVVYGPGGSLDPVDFVWQFFTGHFHLWFLLALTGLYLAVPVLRLVVRDRRIAWYFVSLAAVFAGVVPLLTRLPGAGGVIADILRSMRFEFALGFCAYFVLGHLLNTADLGAGRARRSRLILAVGLGVAGLVVTGVGTVLASRARGRWDEMFYDFATLNVGIVAAAVFVLARAWNERHEFRGAWRRVIGFVSGVSFGVYLVHPFFQLAYRQFGLTTEWGLPFVSVPLLTLLVLLPSLGVAFLVQRIPRAGKYLS